MLLLGTGHYLCRRERGKKKKKRKAGGGGVKTIGQKVGGGDGEEW